MQCVELGWKQEAGGLCGGFADLQSPNLTSGPGQVGSTTPQPSRLGAWSFKGLGPFIFPPKARRSRNKLAQGIRASSSFLMRLITGALFRELCSLNDLHAGWRGKAKALIRYLDVLLLLKKAELGDGAVEFLNYDTSDQTIRGNFK